MQNQMFFPVTDDVKQQTAQRFDDQNEITVMDESMPSPGEIRSEETIVLPEIVSMPEYIRRHYAEEIIRTCREEINDAHLCVMYDGRHFWNVPGRTTSDDGGELILPDGSAQGDWDAPRRLNWNTFSADIRPGDGSITWMRFRRISEYCVEADLTIEMDVHFRCGTRGGFMRIKQKYYTTGWFDFEDGLNAEFGNFTLKRRFDDPDGVPLDAYLVPVFKWDEIEEEAESIILRVAHEGLQDPRWLRPEEFAKRMGLKIVYLPLYKRPRTSSILFFDPGEVLTAADKDEKLDPIPVRVDRNTIVVNNRKSGHEHDAIFHECFHYAEHRLFFQLQQLHNTDIRFLAQWKPVELKEDARSPIEWMEWQANVGSQCLRVPRTLLRERAEKKLSGMQNSQEHMGSKLETVGKILAKEFGVYNYQLRNRMIQVGYPQAKGSLNYVGDGYIVPFAFDLRECHGSQNFVITPKEMLEEYLRNESFRKLIDTGRYVYVDGHICLNSPEYVVLQGDKLLLTKWANEHVDKCCLRFSRNYIRDGDTHYVYGQLNSDEEYNGRNLTLSASAQDPNLYETAVETAKLLTALPGTFHGAFAMIMREMGIKPTELAEETLMAERTIYRYQEVERSDYNVDTVAVLCVGMHLDPLLSFALMERAGVFLRNTPEDLIVKAVLMGMYRMKVVQVQSYLSEIHYPRIEKWPKLPKVDMESEQFGLPDVFE